MLTLNIYNVDENTTKLSWKEECSSCKGTGLYVGMAEHNGAAIQCYNCKGKGEKEIVIYIKSFTGRKTHSKPIKRVFENNPGIFIGENEDLKLEDFGGLSYDEWNNRQHKSLPFPKGLEDRKHICPSWWFMLGVGPHSTFCKWDHGAGRTYSSCPYFETKDMCWKAYDEEQIEKEK
ncbi:hypothetical protein M0R19_05130 [Candidatus Pacearchaeota archaeon]|jgi:hypothetical protein|nr:hypothetical protein [Candidatus Pacearchaeota archaeon]